jgi:hypothetical protein
MIRRISMPAKGESKDATPAPKRARAAATKATKAAPAKSAPAKSAPAEAAPEPEVAESEVPMNRAERRAKGRGKNPSQITGQGKVSGGHGPAPTHRMWANRRSG